MLKKLQEASRSRPDLSVISPPILLLLLCIALETSILSPRALAAIINSRNTALQFLLLSFANPRDQAACNRTASEAQAHHRIGCCSSILWHKL